MTLKHKFDLRREENKKIGPRSARYPMSVLIVALYGKNGVPNVMDVTWDGASEENEISVYLLSPR